MWVFEIQGKAISSAAPCIQIISHAMSSLGIPTGFSFALKNCGMRTTADYHWSKEAIHQDPMSSFPMTISHWHHADNNYSHFQHLYFVFAGIPGLEQKYYRITFPLGAVYVIALFGNSIIISTITSESSLHIPMYYFLCMLVLADMGLALCTLPSMLGIFWFNYKSIAFDACLVQMYFIHTFTAIESGVLVAMAFDQAVAIWTPLRYSTILTNGVVCKTGLVILSRAVFVVFPVPFFIKRLPFYHSNILSHSFCLHQDVMHLACASTCVNHLYGLIAIIFTKGSDSLSILLSYVFILQTVMAIASREGCLKALNTCVSHICAVLIFYVPLIEVSVIHRFGKHLSPLTHDLMANAYLVVSPVLNHIVYTVKTKEIQRKIFQMFVQTKITAEGEDGSCSNHSINSTSDSYNTIYELQ
ncbi:hypothetical protein H8958_019953 [Nasalis larvatus]